jgi:hypothetical protein
MRVLELTAVGIVMDGCGEADGDRDGNTEFVSVHVWE